MTPRERLAEYWSRSSEWMREEYQKDPLIHRTFHAAAHQDMGHADMMDAMVRSLFMERNNYRDNLLDRMRKEVPVIQIINPIQS